MQLWPNWWIWRRRIWMTNSLYVCANYLSTSHLWWIGKLSWIIVFFSCVGFTIRVKLGNCVCVSTLDLWILFFTCCQNSTACWKRTAWSVCWAVLMSSLIFSCTSRPRASPRWWPTGSCTFQCRGNEVTGGMDARQVVLVPHHYSIWSSVLSSDNSFTYPFDCFFPPHKNKLVGGSASVNCP